jgi:riboflavin synthase alpha subunit
LSSKKFKWTHICIEKGELKEGSLVNLERAMSATTRFGGHVVQVARFDGEDVAFTLTVHS